MFHITQAKRTLKQWILDALPLQLAAADAMSADGVRTPPPYEVYLTDKHDLGGYPSIEIIVTDSTPAPGQSFAQIYRHRLVVGVTVGGDDEETISTQVERYIWCLRQVFTSGGLANNDGVSPPDGIAPVDVGGEQYTPLQQRPETVESPFVKGVFLEVFITTVE